jgi:hypothetical protein
MKYSGFVELSPQLEKPGREVIVHFKYKAA